MASGGRNFLVYCKICSASAFPGVEIILPDDSENRVLCASYLGSEGIGSFSVVVKVNMILSYMQFTPHHWSGVGPRHTPWHVALASPSLTPVTLGSLWLLADHLQVKGLRI